ncbi:hypothetical protein Tco_0630711 [Tanacetum coccineum]
MLQICDHSYDSYVNMQICHHSNESGIGSTFTQHHTRGPEHDTHNLVIKTEAYELFKRVYRHVLDENKMEGFCSDSIKLYVGLNMLNDLHLGGFDARAFIHKFSRIDDLPARSGFLLLCNIGFCFRYSSTEVDSLREYFRKSEHLIGSELLRHIRELYSILELHFRNELIKEEQMDDVRLDGVVPNSPSCDLTNEEEEGNPQPPKEGDSNRACTSQTAWTTEEEIALAKGNSTRDKAKNKGSKASGSSTMNDDALARLMVTELTSAEVAQREKFMELEKREVECRE